MGRSYTQLATLGNFGDSSGRELVENRFSSSASLFWLIWSISRLSNLNKFIYFCTVVRDMCR
jgi:hypothetical protein